MTEQEFIDYIADYGTHILFKYGDYTIQKKVHLDRYNSNFSNFPHITSKGEEFYMEFEINGPDIENSRPSSNWYSSGSKGSSPKDCAELITAYERDKKLNKILKGL